MRIDLYTKTILTVIAACLLALTIRSLQEPTKVDAQQLDGLRVVIAGFDLATLGRGLPVNITGTGDQAAVPVVMTARNANVAVPVSIVNAMVPVSVNGTGQDGKTPVAVNVVELGGRTAPSGVVPVNMVQLAGDNVDKGTVTITPAGRGK